nr:metallophosphoesterase [Lactiplantibacillus plantarum]
MIDDIRRLPTMPDLIVFTGDLIHDGSADDYQRLHAIVHTMEAEFDCHVRVILGNHDRRAAFYEGYLPADPGPYYASRMRIGNNDFYFWIQRLAVMRQAGWHHNSYNGWENIYDRHRQSGLFYFCITP